MEQVLNKAKRRRQFLLALSSAMVPILALAAVSFGLNPKFIWIPSLALTIWPFYLLYEKFPTEDPEMSFLQSVRATIYFVDLLFLLPANGLLITPYNPSTILLAPLVAGGSALIDAGIYRSYSEQLKLFDKEQKRLFIKMIVGAGIAPIWLSLAVVQADFVISNLPAVSWILIGVPASLFLGYVFYTREARSARAAQQLAIQLRRSRWQQKLNYQRKRGS